MIICRKPTIFSWGLNCCEKGFWRSWPLKREFCHSMIYSNKLTFISWCFITIEHAEVNAIARPIVKRDVSSFSRLQQTLVTSFEHDFLLKSRNLSLMKFATPPPYPAPRKTLRGGSKTGPGKRRKSSSQTHLFMLNIQVNNQSHLNTKWKYYSPVSELVLWPWRPNEDYQ